MSIEDLKKTARTPVENCTDAHKAARFYGGMGNGEKDNALANALKTAHDNMVREMTPPFPTKPDLCVCGPKTRAERDCECDSACEKASAKIQEYADKVYKPESVLQEADRLVSSDRGSTYGPPIDDFSKVTGMAKALWGRGPESPEEHALYMVLVKLARLEATPGHHDSIVDAAGYLKTYAMVIDERVKRITDKG